MKRLAILLVLFAGCTAPITSGTITAKHHEPAHWESYTDVEPHLVYDFHMDDGEMTFGPRTVWTSVQKQRWVNDKYAFDLAAGDQTGTVIVSAADYELWVIGATYSKETNQ